jgi:PAS domain S-box-containing protein
VFFVLGCGLVALGGTKSFFLNHFFNDSSGAKVLRAILPIVVLSLLADDILDVVLTQLIPVTHVMISAALALLLIPVTMWLIVKVSQIIFKGAEKAEAERKKMEAALQESEKSYRLIFENQGEGIGLVDPDECFVFANPAAERIFGVPAGGLISRNLKDFLPPDQMIKVLAETKKRANYEKSSYEIDIISADNIVKNILVTATPQISAEGIFTGTFGIFRDITIRRQAQADLEKISDALKESNATKDKFFSILAHDLKSPFNSILGLTNALITDYRFFNEKEIEHTLTTIKKASEGAFDLLENLLLWANSQTGQINYNPEEFNLGSTISETIALVEIQAARKNIRIGYSGAENDIVTADIQMVQTILRNLMSNAIKFTPTGGEVTVSVKKTDNCYEISVKDTGVGIGLNDLSKLFKIESKHSTRGTSNEKGTGLGLILCKEFVEKHGGKIWVESEEWNLSAGKTGGSKFSFTLPY